MSRFASCFCFRSCVRSLPDSRTTECMSKRYTKRNSIICPIYRGTKIQNDNVPNRPHIDCLVVTESERQDTKIIFSKRLFLPIIINADPSYPSPFNTSATGIDKYYELGENFISRSEKIKQICGKTGSDVVGRAACRRQLRALRWSNWRIALSVVVSVWLIVNSNKAKSHIDDTSVEPDRRRCSTDRNRQS